MTTIVTTEDAQKFGAVAGTFEAKGQRELAAQLTREFIDAVKGQGNAATLMTTFFAAANAAISK